MQDGHFEQPGFSPGTFVRELAGEEHRSFQVLFAGTAESAAADAAAAQAARLAAMDGGVEPEPDVGVLDEDLFDDDDLMSDDDLLLEKEKERAERGQCR